MFHWRFIKERYLALCGGPVSQGHWALVRPRKTGIVQVVEIRVLKQFVHILPVMAKEW